MKFKLNIQENTQLDEAQSNVQKIIDKFYKVQTSKGIAALNVDSKTGVISIQTDTNPDGTLKSLPADGSLNRLVSTKDGKLAYSVR